MGQITGRRVLQPGGNRVLPGQETGLPAKKLHDIEITPLHNPESDVSDQASQSLLITRSPNKKEQKNTKSASQVCINIQNKINSPKKKNMLATPPKSFATGQREKATVFREEKIKRTAHYGRTTEKNSAVDPPSSADPTAEHDTKRCSFITPNTDPIYAAYHDEEWGVPVHDVKMLFELLTLAEAQVGSDWTTILKKREDFRSAFAGFDAELVANFSEKQIVAISSKFKMESRKIRNVVDNANCILKVNKEFGSLDHYLWGFVNHKPISTQYSRCRKIPTKTSKSEAISKDMVRRGFRFVGSVVIHSFMQAAGLTNDHLLSCPRRSILLQKYCSSGPSSSFSPIT
ncbi:uncharacterized protein LOC144707566 isoform X2 [Wolffia australiana]